MNSETKNIFIFRENRLPNQLRVRSQEFAFRMKF